MPDIALVPVIGWDVADFRSGYGSGYFDRTPSALRPQPFAIAIGVPAAQIATIYPQPHDIRLDEILAEEGAKICARLDMQTAYRRHHDGFKTCSTGRNH